MARGPSGLRVGRGPVTGSDHHQPAAGRSTPRRGRHLLLTPGYFAERIRDSSLAAGAAAVSPVLGASAEVADVLLDRFRSRHIPIARDRAVRQVA